ncbi:globin [Shewanella nanhaiensis]|uniref:Globin n=1 Tax=Shewanella nanhaiensis TaxID=2864872 RepID=A0ABS7E9B8_9GAMM|nr:globin [Shewanella nanhaiensis]MBW8186261.1 globin [Shewanella nanhaiensis]
MSTEIDFNEIFNNSYDFIARNEDLFYKTFYEVFINSCPQVKMAFKHTDMVKQNEMVRESFGYMICFFVTKVADEHLIKLAKDHKDKFHVDSELYTVFVNSVLAALEKIYPRYNNECAVAWRITMAPGIEFMKHIYDVE